MNFPPRRQPTFADVPALEFSPVILWRSRSDRRRLDIAGRLAAQNPHGNTGDLPTHICNDGHRTTDDPVTKKGIIFNKYRRVSHRVKTLHRLSPFVRDSGRI